MLRKHPSIPTTLAAANASDKERREAATTHDGNVQPLSRERYTLAFRVSAHKMSGTPTEFGEIHYLFWQQPKTSSGTSPSAVEKT